MTTTRLLRRTFLAQALLLLLGGAAAAGCLLQHRALDLRRHDDEAVVVTLESLRSEVLSAETGLRGYVLVGRPSFLEPYEVAFPTIARDLAAARTSYGGDARIVELQRLIGEWRSRFAEPVLAHLQDGRRDLAHELLRTGAGKRRIDAVRTLVDDLLAEQAGSIAESRRQADAVMALAGTTVVGLCVLLAASAAGLVRLLERRLSDPMVSLTAAAARIGAGDLAARSPIAGTAEVRRTAQAFNQMADQMEATVDELRSLDRMKGELMSVVSHELRTPLTSIRGSLGLLGAGVYGPLSDEARDMLAIAASNTDRLVRLINEILDLERMESGRITLDVRPQPVAKLLDDAVATNAGGAQAAGVELAVADGADVTVPADADRIAQVLTNLVGNAIKFSPAGGRVVLGADRVGDEVAIRVADEGRGIPADRLPHIFERFEQVDASDSRDRGGTGLGLAIASRIAEQHGGRITVSSTVGRGSTFVLWLPCPRATTSAPAEAGAAARHGIVVVEDDAELAHVIAAALARHGVQVAMAAGAAEAVQLSERVDPDLLVLDVALADGDGFDVVARLRAHDRLRDVPVIVFTGLDLDEHDRARLCLGPTEFLVKGHSDVATVEERVVALLRTSAGAAPAGAAW